MVEALGVAGHSTEAMELELEVVLENKKAASALEPAAVLALDVADMDRGSMTGSLAPTSRRGSMIGSLAPTSRAHLKSSGDGVAAGAGGT